MVVLFVEEENGFPHFRSTRRVTPAHETTVADCGGFVGTGNWWRGKAVDDRRQGCGRKRYVNGDYYEGEWHRNLQQGKGRYVWRNGNQYVGEWKNGVISGRGVLIWANGNRYDGHWDNGVPKGNGVFTWPDGSCYVMDSSSSSFSSSSSHFSSSLHGTFYSSFKSTPDFMKQSTVDVTTGRGSYSGEKHFPRICIWESDGVAGDITCDIIDALQASLLYKDGTDAAATESKEQKRIERQNNTPWSFAGDDAPKKPGRTITKDHKKYDLMRNLQLGISCSVGKSATTREIRTNDFNQKQKFWTRFPAEGSKMTPPHTSTEFRWKDYCPMLFRHLRKLFGVDPTDYILAICGNGALRELSSPGKSGSFFYLTQDDRFMIKTVKKSEAKVLMKMLPAYYNHVTHHSNTLLTRFFGVHCVKPIGGQKVRFVVMGNFFRPSEHRIHRRFDLKGSRHGRSASTEKIDETTTLKDLDLNLVFKVEPTSIQALLGQIEADCGFLEAERIMDYSLLIGLHFHDDNSAGLETTRGSWKMAARAEVVSNGWGFERSGDVYDVIKSLHVDPTTISAVDPKLYSRRFRDFVRRIFVLEKTWQR